MRLPSSTSNMEMEEQMGEWDHALHAMQHNQPGSSAQSASCGGGDIGVMTFSGGCWIVCHVCVCGEWLWI